MKKLQLKKEVISNLDSKDAAMIKGGNHAQNESWDLTTAISSLYPTCVCDTRINGNEMK